MSKDHSSTAAPAPVQPGVARVGKYLMLDLLGEGAFGKVRLAVDEGTGKEYAMKIMAKSHIKANELTLQVRREIAVTKAMRHPNIVNLHEVLTSSKNIYMVMELVTGGELFDAVAESGRLSEATARLYFQQLIDGIHYCHNRRVYHRDLKPENLLLSGDKQTLKITDFGLSSIKAQNASSELLHTIMGSPHYIAPEIITSAAEGYEGSKVDVWAAGIILFGMLAGYLPFDDSNTKALYKAIVHSPIQYPPHFSYDVIKLLRAMLQKDPNRRPSMEQVKTFTWFKVDYEPAIIPAEKHPSHSDDRPRKARQKSKKRDERGSKQRRSNRSFDPESKGSRDRFLDTESRNSRDRDVDPERRRSKDRKADVDRSGSVEKSLRKFGNATGSSKLGEKSSRLGRPVSKRHSGLFGLMSRHDSEASEKLSEKESFTALEQLSRQESADIRQPQGYRFNKDILNRTIKGEDVPVSPGIEHSESYLRKRADGTTSHARVSGSFSEGPSASRNESDGIALIAEQSTQSATDSGSRSWFSADAHPSYDGENSRKAGQVSSLKQQNASALFKDEASTDATDASTECEQATEALNGKCRDSNPDLSSPLTPGDSHFSPVNSDRVSSSQGQRLEKSLNFPGNGLNVHQVGLSNFISPVSMRSQISFSSPNLEGAQTPLFSPDYCSLGPKRLSSSKSLSKTDGDSNKMCGVAMTGTEARPGASKVFFLPVSADSDTADGLKEVPSEIPTEEGFEHGTALPGAEREDLGIFKPMKSMFATLVEQTSEETRPSMAPSVYCPDVDNDPEGGPQWCLDSVEVFADVEFEESDAPRTRGTTPSQKLLEILKQRQGAGTSSSGSGSDRFLALSANSRSIFTPLDDKLTLTLTPSVEAEELATKAVRKLSLIKPAL